VFDEKDNIWMQRALQLAKRAAACNEVPVGAIVVHNDKIIGQGFNQCIQKNDPTAHAEIIALREAAESIGNYRLVDTSLYVTLEPCMMCAGAMVHSRIKHLVHGAYDTRTGAIVSQVRLLDQSFVNHRVSYMGGLMREECGDLLTQFFRGRRE